MADPRCSSRYDWSRPGEPPALARRVADHRVLVRVFLLVTDVALVGLLVTGLATADHRWYQYLQLPVWAWLTVNFGWLLPRSVDDWRRRRDQPAP